MVCVAKHHHLATLHLRSELPDLVAHEVTVEHKLRVASVRVRRIGGQWPRLIVDNDNVQRWRRDARVRRM